MFTVQQIQAAKWVFSEALETTQGSAVLIVHDEETAPTAHCLLEAANAPEIGAQAQIVDVPFERQVAHSRLKHIDPALKKVIDKADRVIMLQKTAPEVSYFRLAVLEYCIQQRRGCRAASMPGVTLDYLPLCLGDLKAITWRCELMADLLVRSHEARLLTTSLNGQEMSLSIPLGNGWPIKSTGRILPNDWGNVPSGETFLVPTEYAAKGEVVIDGSILYYPIPDDEELMLSVDRGIVHPLVRAKGIVGEKITTLLFNSAGREVYDSCSHLCELGVGTNGDINRFTGLQLFDEKILGTVHLGFGRNRQFQGSIESPVHNDFVTRRPTLLVDDVVVTDKGKFVLSEEDVYPNWRRVKPISLLEDQVLSIGPEIAKLDGDQAFLSWVSPRGQSTQLTRVGDLETSAIAAKILKVAEKARDQLTMNDVLRCMKGKCEPEAIRATIALLSMYSLVES